MSRLLEQIQQTPSPDGATSSIGSPEADPLFPLPLVPFEQYMLADDRRHYPMTFPMQVELEGIPDRVAFDAAFRDALARHPLLNCRVAKRGSKQYWVPTQDSPPVLRWIHETEPEQRLGRHLDLRRQSPVEGYVFAQRDRAILGLLFHHAACDGIGAMQFIGDVLAAYGQRVDGEHEPPRLLAVTAETLRVRGQFETPAPFEISAWDAFWGTVRETWKVLSRRPRALVSRQNPQALPKQPAVLQIARMEPEVYRNLSRHAQALKVTANDLLLRDMFVTVSQWNGSHVASRGGWMRINMPTSLRGKRDTRMPAANVLGYAMLTRHTRECDDRQRLLEAIASDTKAIRAWSLGAMFVDALRTTAQIPFGMFLGTRLMRRSATVVLSNLGDPSRRFRARFPRADGKLQAGNLRLRTIAATPPIRPGTHMAVAVINNGGELTLGLNFDPRCFSAADAASFLQQYKQQLERTAGEADNTKE